jgi:hypothetical protein
MTPLEQHGPTGRQLALRVDIGSGDRRATAATANLGIHLAEHDIIPLMPQTTSIDRELARVHPDATRPSVCAASLKAANLEQHT